MDLYAENILDHYRNPRGKSPSPWGEGKPFGSELMAEGGEGVITHSESNPACGDEITIGITIRNDRIHDICWDGTGCAISQAAMSMLSEALSGKSPEEVDAITKEYILALLGVPIGPRRLKCALLGLHTLKNALRKEQGKTLKGWTESVLWSGILPHRSPAAVAQW